MSTSKITAVLVGSLMALLLWGSVSVSWAGLPLPAARPALAPGNTPNNPPSPTPTPTATRRRVTLPRPPGTLVNVQPVATPTPTPRFGNVRVPSSGVLEPACANAAVMVGPSIVEVWSQANMPLQVHAAFQNTGSCTWDSAYTFSFEAKEEMGANPPNVPAPATAPQAVAPFAVNLVAPVGGTHVGYWRMQAPDGSRFGPIVTFVVHVTS